MATYPVKYIHEGMRGAPVLNGQPGSLIALLDAFLLTGFGLTTALSVSVTAGVATATLTPGSTFEPDCVVLISGATPAALNGEARVLTSSNTSITWATTAADGAATGTITIRVAPVGGWEKKYSGTNKSVYRSTDAGGTGFCLRIDDAGTTTCRARGYEVMTDVDTGTGPFPTDAQISGGSYWHKSIAANAVAVGYVLAADSRAIRIAISPASGSTAANTAAVVRGFGDEVGLSPSGDAYCCTISANSSSATAGSAGGGGYSNRTSGVNGIYFARPWAGLGGSTLARSIPYSGREDDDSGTGATMGAFPSAVDGELKLSRRYLTLSAADTTPRANIAGYITLPQSNVIASISRLSKIAGAGELAGRVLLAITNVSSGNYPSQPPTGIDLLDITGPWR